MITAACCRLIHFSPLLIRCPAQVVKALDTDVNGKLDYLEFVNAFQKPNNLAGTQKNTQTASADKLYDHHGIDQDYYAAAHQDANGSRTSSVASDNRAFLNSALGQHALVGG